MMELREESEGLAIDGTTVVVNASNRQETGENQQASGPSEKSLIEAARMGEADSFGMLVERYQDRVYTLALRLTGDADRAAELAQESFLKGWRGIRNFRGESGFYTWMFRITINEFRSGIRSTASRPMVVSMDGDHSDGAMQLADKNSDPVEDAERTERKRLVEEALQRLDTEQRMLILLRDMEGRSYNEIAELIECPCGTVKSRLHRARMALKDMLSKKLRMTGA